MNLDTNSSKKPLKIMATDDMDFDFKPITSGLGFHNEATTEIKPLFHENRPSVATPSVPRIKIDSRKEMNHQIYQNDLAMFYGRETHKNGPVEQQKPEKIIRLANTTQRLLAYILDLGLILSCLGLVLTIMARSTDLDLMKVWSDYPNDITPLALILFSGFYLIYFAIFEKTAQSTLGKNLLGIKVLKTDNKLQSFNLLLLRSFISLTNFASLGLFSYFNLQNKVSDTKVVRID